MNKTLLTGLLALTATSAVFSTADARPRYDRYDRREWREDRRHDRQENVADRIDRAFDRDRVLGHYDLDTDTVGRTIEIEGRVRSGYERNRAVDLARRVAPNYRIVNRITVR